MVETRPNLAEEINVFKRIVQHVARQDIAKEQAAMFRAEDKQHYKRLKNLGPLGHQAAIQANCEIDPVTQEIIEEAIFCQKLERMVSA